MKLGVCCSFIPVEIVLGALAEGIKLLFDFEDFFVVSRDREEPFGLQNQEKKSRRLQLKQQKFSPLKVTVSGHCCHFRPSHIIVTKDF